MREIVPFFFEIPLPEKKIRRSKKKYFDPYDIEQKLDLISFFWFDHV